MIPETIKLLISLLLVYLGVKVINKYIVIDSREERKSYYEREEYSKLIEMNQSLDPKRQWFYSYKYEMLLLYFMNGDLENYKRMRNKISPMLRLCRDDCYVISTMDILTMYLDGKSEEARSLFFKTERKSIKYMAKHHDVENRHFWDLVYFPKYCFDNDYESLKKKYDECATGELNKYSWAIMNYYFLKANIDGNLTERSSAEQIRKNAEEILQGNGYLKLFYDLELDCD